MTKTYTASSLNVYYSFKSLLLLILADVHHLFQWELNFLITFIPVFFSFLPWKLSCNIKLLLTCSFFFFFLLIGKMSLFSIFRLMTSPLSIKLNDFYCLWGLLPHSFSSFHQFSSFLIPLAFLFCPQTASDLPYALPHFF